MSHERNGTAGAHEALQDERKASFKAGIGERDGLELRIERSVGLRKEKRQQRLNRRRYMGKEPAPAHAHSAHSAHDNAFVRPGDNGSNEKMIKNLDVIRDAYQRYIPILQNPSQHATKTIMDALHAMDNFTDTIIPTRVLLEAGLTTDVIGIIAPYVKMFQGKPNQGDGAVKALSHAWSALANIVSIKSRSDWCRTYIECDLFQPAIAYLIHGDDKNTVYNIIWGLCNVIHTKGEFARRFIQCGGIQSMIRVYTVAIQCKDLEILAVCMWLTHNLYMCIPALKWDDIAPLWPYVIMAIKTSYVPNNDACEMLLSDALWCCSFVARRGYILPETMRKDVDFTSALYRMINVEAGTIHLPLMRALSNVNCHNDERLLIELACIESNPKAFLTRMHRIFAETTSNQIRADIAYFWGNLLANPGGREMLPIFFESHIYKSICLKLTHNQYCEGTAYFVFCIFATICHHLRPIAQTNGWDAIDMHMRYFVENTEMIAGLMTHVQAYDPKCTLKILRIIQDVLEWRKKSPAMLQCADDVCNVANELEDRFFIDILSELENDGCTDVSELADAISTTYFIDMEYMDHLYESTHGASSYNNNNNDMCPEDDFQNPLYPPQLESSTTPMLYDF